MSCLLIVQPIRPVALSVNRGSGLGNLLTDDPREAWQSDIAGSEAAIIIDLGVIQPVDTVFVGYTNAVPGSTMSVSSAQVSGQDTYWEGGAFPAQSSRRSAMRHGFSWRNTLGTDGLRRPAPIMARYLVVRLTQGPGGAPLYAGVVMVGASFQPGLGHEYGAGRTPIDTGTRERLPSGGFGVSPGVKKGSWDWTLGDLSTAEREQLYALSLDLGETSSVLVVEDPDRTAGLAERLHWSMFDKLQPYERINPALTKWSFRVEDWS